MTPEQASKRVAKLLPRSPATCAEIERIVRRVHDAALERAARIDENPELVRVNGTLRMASPEARIRALKTRAPAQEARPRGEGATMSWFFYVYQGESTSGRPGMWGARLASGSAGTREDVEREGARYLAQYQQDGPAFLVIRKSPTRKPAIRALAQAQENEHGS